MSAFDKYVTERMAAGTVYKSVSDEKKKAKSLTQDASMEETASDHGSSEEMSFSPSPSGAETKVKSELQQANEEALSSGGSVLADEIEESMKEQEGEDLMSFAKSISEEAPSPASATLSKAKVSGGSRCSRVPKRRIARPLRNARPSVRKPVVKKTTTAGEEAGEEEEEEDSFEERMLSSGHVMVDRQLNQAMDNLMVYAKMPVHTLHKMTSKGGQQLVKDNLSEHLTRAAACVDEDGDFDFSRVNKKGCKHFRTPEHADKASVDGLTSVYSLLSHAEKDDGISSMISNEATARFIEIRDMAHALSCENKSEVMHHFPTSEISADFDLKGVKDVPVKRLSSAQLRAIERNYAFAAATAFATWGQTSLRKQPEMLSEEARKLAQEAHRWLASPKKKGGAKYDDADNGIYVGYQTMIAFLSTVISELPQNFKDTDITKSAVANAASEATMYIRGAVENKLFPTEYLNYDPPGETESKGKRGRKAKKLGRRGGSKLVRFLADRELPILRRVVKEASVFYNRAVAAERRKQAAEGKVSKVFPDRRMELLLYVLRTTVRKEAKNAVTRIGRMNRATIKSSLYDVYEMTIRAMALTAIHIATEGYGKYQPRNNPEVTTNLLIFIGGDVIPRAQEEIDDGDDGGDTSEAGSQIRINTTAVPRETELSAREHDAFVEAMLTLKNYVHQNEERIGVKRTGRSSPLHFLVVVPNESKLVQPRDRRRVYDNIHRYIFENHKEGIRSIHTGDHPHTALKVSGPIRLSGESGAKLGRWIERKNVHVHLRKSVG
jgi:hypothetical protein